MIDQTQLENEILRAIFDLKIALDDARNGVPIDGDEYYESDDWYHGAIAGLEQALNIIKGGAK